MLMNAPPPLPAVDLIPSLSLYLFMCMLTPSLVAHCSCLLVSSSPFHLNSILVSMDRWLGRGKTSLVCLLLVGLLSHNVVTPVVSRSLQEFDEQKNYYPPATGSTPTRKLSFLLHVYVFVVSHPEGSTDPYSTSYAR